VYYTHKGIRFKYDVKPACHNSRLVHSHVVYFDVFQQPLHIMLGSLYLEFQNLMCVIYTLLVLFVQYQLTGAIPAHQLEMANNVQSAFPGACY
jgi:hypothetical protein